MQVLSRGVAALAEISKDSTMDYRAINRIWQSATLFVAPPLIVLYEGDNDLSGGKSVERVFADWTSKGWKIAGGTYRFALGASADDLIEEAQVQLTERTWNYAK